MFAPANMIEAREPRSNAAGRGRTNTDANPDKDRVIEELQSELQRYRSEVDSLKPLESFFIQMNQTYMERYSNRNSSVRDSERPSDVFPGSLPGGGESVSQMAHTFNGK
jgi:hypothetical protein